LLERKLSRKRWPWRRARRKWRTFQIRIAHDTTEKKSNRPRTKTAIAPERWKDSEMPPKESATRAGAG